jgi:hypothetical protein
MVGEAVPCRRHGSCTVRRSEQPPPQRRLRPRAPSRTVEEVVAYVEERGSASFGELRQHRFPLRLVALGEQADRFDVDWLAGIVRSTARDAPS